MALKYAIILRPIQMNALRYVSIGQLVPKAMGEIPIKYHFHPMGSPWA